MGPEVRRETGPRPTRLLIVDDHKLFADLIRPPLEERGIHVIGLARDGTAALAAVRDGRPDIVLLDLGLPDEDGLSVGRRIRAEHPETKLVAVISFADGDAARKAIDAGFHASVTKDTPLTQFVSRIEGVLNGHVSTHHRSTFHEDAEAIGRNRSPLELLTPREYEVLMMLAEGLSSHALAERLVLSPNTVRTHVQSVLIKLQVHSRIEAAAVALRHGLGNGYRR
jgi:two-component system, NarL family, nitrate/nitrite response regulator NarL